MRTSLVCGRSVVPEAPGAGAAPAPLHSVSISPFGKQPGPRLCGVGLLQRTQPARHPHRLHYVLERSCRLHPLPPPPLPQPPLA